LEGLWRPFKAISAGASFKIPGGRKNLTEIYNLLSLFSKQRERFVFTG
jgi:hypothetical protein